MFKKSLSCCSSVDLLSSIDAKLWFALGFIHEHEEQACCCSSLPTNIRNHFRLILLNQHIYKKLLANFVTGSCLNGITLLTGSSSTTSTCSVSRTSSVSTPFRFAAFEPASDQSPSRTCTARRLSFVVS